MAKLTKREATALVGYIGDMISVLTDEGYVRTAQMTAGEEKAFAKLVEISRGR